jgi:cytochrome c553
MRRTILLALAGVAPALAAPGLVATYSDGAVTLREVVPAPHFYLDEDETLHPALQEDFGAVFRGRLSILQNGRYELFAGPAELEIDGRPAAGPLVLDSGDHPIQLRYSSARGPRGVRLEWQGPGFAREPVPARLLSHAAADAPRPIERLAETGRRLAAELGCANCHLAASTLPKRPGPPLDGIGSRTSAAWLKRWLENPQSFRASAVMPRTTHRSDANDLAEYLMTLTGGEPPEPRLRRQDGETGFTLFQSLGCIACHGEDGVSLDGLGSKTTAGHLQRYLLDPFVWEPSGRMPSLGLSEQQALELGAYLALSKKPAFERQPLGGDAERGRQRFENAGCVACHQLEGSANRLASPAMDQLDPARGCLADAPTEPAPLFSLAPSQREALRAFVGFYKANPDRTRAPIHDFRARLEQLRCNSCHEVEGRPATAALAEQAPSLTALGEKMQTAWLRRVLSRPTHTYDWLELRMPSYHPQHVGVLAEGFAKAAGLEPGSGEAPPELTSAQYVDGRGALGVLPGKGGMGCIGCHGWNEHESLGEHGPNLAQASQRLRYDWFLRWMRDPARIHTGTSMPNYFSGQTPEDSLPKLELLWAGLEAPSSAGLPPGFEQQAAKLGSEALPQPTDEAIVVRWDMPEATPAAIAVGLPGEVSYCFDAGESRLLYAWQGGFVDLGPTLYQKTNKATGLTETAHLVGQIFYRQTAFPIRVGDPERIPQRHFRGYRMVDGAPELHYQADGLDVYERIVLRGGELVRQFRLPRVDRPTWLVLASGEGARVATSLGSGLERLQLPRGENVRFEVRIAVR